MPIQYSLQPNPVTPDPNDHSARVTTPFNLSDAELAEELVKRGIHSDVDHIRAIVSAYLRLLAERVADGFAVNSALMTVRPGISGVFSDAEDSFDPSRHVLRANLQMGTLLEEAMAAATTEKLVEASPAPLLTSFMNKNTGGINATISPGGIGQLLGEQLKYDPAAAGSGIFFVLTSTGAATAVPAANVAVRTEGELMFLTPTLAAGSYRVEVRRSYRSNTEMRTGALRTVLTVA
jgi:hypothetical protein